MLLQLVAHTLPGYTPFIDAELASWMWRPLRQCFPTRSLVVSPLQVGACAVGATHASAHGLRSRRAELRGRALAFVAPKKPR
jgi:hypothetical protein